MWKCINVKKMKECKFLFKGVVIGTDEPLCNIFSEHKPCETECVCIGECKCEKEKSVV